MDSIMGRAMDKSRGRTGFSFIKVSFMFFSFSYGADAGRDRKTKTGKWFPAAEKKPPSRYWLGGEKKMSSGKIHSKILQDEL